MWSVSASSAAQNGGNVTPNRIGNAKNIQTSTTSTGIARMRVDVEDQRQRSQSRPVKARSPIAAPRARLR